MIKRILLGIILSTLLIPFNFTQVSAQSFFDQCQPPNNDDKCAAPPQQCQLAGVLLPGQLIGGPSGGGGAPGCDHPDEMESVSTLSIGSEPFILESPDVIILNEGYWRSSRTTFQVSKIPYIYTDIQSSSSMLKETAKILILPTGSLAGLENSEILKANLDDFVKQGGILVVFTQQQGYEFIALPGGEVSGYGFREDKSCQANAASIDEYHTILSSQKDLSFDGGIDGFFTMWPEGSKILLRRTKNNMPALILYPYGSGYVIATTLYTDYSYTQGSITEDEIALIKDIISWAKNPKEYVEVKPGQSITIPITITNNTTQDANSVKLKILDGSKNVFKEETISLFVPAGQTITYNYTFTAPSNLGIYSIYYQLPNTDYQLFSDNFAVSLHLTGITPAPELSFSVTSPSEEFAYGQDVTFTIHIWNNSDRDRELSLYWYSHVSSPCFIGKYTVLAKSKIEIPHTTNRIYFTWWGGNNWDYYILVLDEQENRLTGHWSSPLIGVAGYWYEPSVDMQITTDKKEYTLKENVNIGLNIKNLQNVDYDTEIKITAVAPGNVKIYEVTKIYNLSANQEIADAFSFILPSDIKLGVWTITAEATSISTGKKIGSGATYFEVPKAKFTISPTLPETFLLNHPNNISFNIQNTGIIDIQQGRLNVKLVDPDNQVVWEDGKDFNLAVGETKSLEFNFTLSSLKFGDYKLIYSSSAETGRGPSGNIILPNPVIMDVQIEKTTYRIREALNFNLKITDFGKFYYDLPLKITIDALNWTRDEVINVLSGETKTLSYTVPIPETTSAGTHTVRAILGGENNSLEKISYWTIPAFSTIVSLPTDGGYINVSNRGGVDGTIRYELKLVDKDNIIVSTLQGQERIPAGGEISINYIKQGLITGTYNLYLNYEEIETLKKRDAPFFWTKINIVF